MAKAAAPVAFDPSASKDQAVVVGNDIVLFAKGIAAEQRSDIVNALLLAQLAKKTVQSPSVVGDVERWYEEYLEVLSNIGFAFKEPRWERLTGDPRHLDLHEVVADVARVTLDPAALTLVAKALTSLRHLPTDSPAVSLFAVKAQQRVAHFQVVLVEPGATGELRLQTMTFGLQTAEVGAQILFFKSTRSVNALLRGTDSGTVNMDVLSAVRGSLASKLATHVGSKVASIDVD
jgi:hypothetical protein